MKFFRYVVACKEENGLVPTASLRFLVTGFWLLVVCASGLAGSLPLGEFLNRTGKAVELLQSQLPRVTCMETLSQTRFGKDGKSQHHQDSVFDYLVLMQQDGNEPTVEESRVAQRQPANEKKVLLLVTTGFSTLALIFHPYFQSSFEYEPLPDEALEGKSMLRLRFRHVRGSRSPTALRLRGRDYPLELEGTAWIDPDSGAIARIDAGLMSPMEDVGLRAFRSVVRYAPMKFDGVEQIHWLPIAASIEVETARQHWLNTHHFTNYKRFSVTTQTTIVQ